MNSYFANTADSNIIQPSISLEPSKDTLNGASSTIDGLPFFGLGEQGLIKFAFYYIIPNKKYAKAKHW